MSPLVRSPMESYNGLEWKGVVQKSFPAANSYLCDCDLFLSLDHLKVRLTFNIHRTYIQISSEPTTRRGFRLPDFPTYMSTLGSRFPNLCLCKDSDFPSYVCVRIQISQTRSAKIQISQPVSLLGFRFPKLRLCEDSYFPTCVCVGIHFSQPMSVLGSRFPTLYLC